MADYERRLKAVVEFDDSQLKKGTAASQDSLANLSKAIFSANAAYDLFKKAVGAATNFIKDSIDIYKRTDAALISLKTTANAFGQDIEVANKSALELADDGLLSIETSAASLRALLSTGLSIDQATNLMRAYKDEAAFGRSQNISYEQAVRNLAESFMTESSIIGNLSGQTENYNVIIDIGAQKLGKKASQLSYTERQTAKYLGTLQVAMKAEGDAARMGETLIGSQAKLEHQMKRLKKSIGEAFAPALTMLIQDMNRTLSGGADDAGKNVETLAAKLLMFEELVWKVALVVQYSFENLGRTATFQFGKSRKAFEELQENLKYTEQRTVDALVEMMQAGEDSAAGLGESGRAIREDFEETGEKIADETRKFEREMKKRTAAFNEHLEDLLFSKVDQRKKLEKDLDKENKSYEEALEERREDRERNDAKEKLQHERKIYDLEKDLARELAKGKEADEERLEDIRLRIARENEDWELANKEKEILRQEEDEKEKEHHQTRVDELQETLDELKALEEKYAEDFAKIKDKVQEDDIARLKRKFEEEKAELLEQHNERVGDYKTQGFAEGAAYGAAFNEGVASKKEEIKQTTQKVATGIKWEISQVVAGWEHGKPPGWQHGGVVPQTGLALLHKGERVVPKTGADVNYNTARIAPTINFYGGVSVRSDQDIDELANKIMRVMGRQAELERWFG